MFALFDTLQYLYVKIAYRSFYLIPLSHIIISIMRAPMRARPFIVI